MKATEITMQIVKNMGNFETVRMEASYTLDPTDNIDTAFVEARKQLENAFKKAYPTKVSKTSNVDVSDNLKDELKMNTAEFDRICKAIFDGKTDFVEVRKHYRLSQEVINYMKENKLV